MREDIQRLADILSAIAEIEDHAAHGKSDTLPRGYHQAILYNLIVIGEAARSVSKPLTSQHPDVPWSKIVGFRNILTHSYFLVDQDEVRRILREDVPRLKGRVAAILRNLEDE